MPEVITVNSSERVSRARYGRMVRGASVWPRNREAATLSDSAPLVPISLAITTAKPRTTHCMTPRWYITAKSAATKITVGKT